MEERLRKFAGLIDAGSYTKAAHQLHISQPALTVAVAKLERELGVQLVTRDHRGIAPTRAGRLAYQAAKDLSVTTSNLQTDLSTIVLTSVGMIDSLAEGLFANPEVARKIKSQLAITVDRTSELVEAVMKDNLDTAYVVGWQRSFDHSIDAAQVAVEPMVLVALPSLSEYTSFVSYDNKSNSYQIIDKALRDRGWAVTSRYSSTSPAVILQLVLQDQGAAVLPLGLVGDHLEAGRLVLLDVKPIERPIVRVTRRGKKVTTLATMLETELIKLLAHQKELLVTLAK